MHSSDWTKSSSKRIGKSSPPNFCDLPQYGLSSKSNSNFMNFVNYNIYCFQTSHLHCLHQSSSLLLQTLPNLKRNNIQGHILIAAIFFFSTQDIWPINTEHSKTLVFTKSGFWGLLHTPYIKICSAL